MKQRWVLLFLLVLVGLSVMEGMAAKPKVTISTYSNPRFEIMRDVLLPKWQKAHPDIELEVMSYPDFWNKMLVLMGSDLAPDIIDTAGTYLFGHVVRSGAVDLTPYLPRERSLSSSNFYNVAWNEVRWPQPDGNGIFALPYDTVGTMLWYNQDLLASSAVNPPTPAWTWNDLRAASRKVAKDTNGDGINDVYGLSVGTTHVLFDPLVKSFGGYVLKPDRKSSGLDSPQAAEALRFLADMVLQDRTAGIGASFANGKAAFQIEGSYFINTVGRVEGLNWGVTTVPAGPVARNAYGGSNMWEVIRRPGQDMNAIMTMLPELLSMETLEAFWSSYLVPYSLPSWRPAASRLKPSRLQQVLLDSLQYMTDADWSPDWAQWQTAKRGGIDPVLRGERSVQDGLLAAKQAIDIVLNNAYGVK